MRESMELVVRTPHAEILRRRISALRISTDSGSVGILPGAESAVLAIEPGLVIARDAERQFLVGTAGGILWLERDRATILSPVAIVGDDTAVVRSRMEALARGPSIEMELRRRIETLERGLMSYAQRGGLPRRMRATEER